MASVLAFNIGFLEVGWVDLIDITLVAVLLYQIYKLIRGSLAMNIFLGILALYLIYLSLWA
jgi:DNA integrity scanning protein DisA with diadenylate cyclase activity